MNQNLIKLKELTDHSGALYWFNEEEIVEGADKSLFEFRIE
ncbi:hypothetical protein [Leptospira chreensis]|nr:hypothetical protein [Leptospira chreensis]